MAEEKKLSGPDFAVGVSLSEFADGGMVQGHAKGEAILVARRGDAYVAIGASCTHYGGPLAEGLIAGGTVRCPWHHACFQSGPDQIVKSSGARIPGWGWISPWLESHKAGPLGWNPRPPGPGRATTISSTPRQSQKQSS